MKSTSATELDAPLLRDDVSRDGSDESPRDYEQEQGVPGLLCNAFAGILGPCTRLILDLVRNIGLIPRPPPKPLVLSDDQRLRLERLRADVKVMYDPKDPEHEAALRHLWDLAFPARLLPAMQTPDWKEMGWQGNDPATDFRSAGLISLQHLTYLAANHTRIFKRLMMKEDGTRSEWEYPFAVGGVNVSFMLTELLELRKETQVSSSAVFRGFAQLMVDDDHALEEVFTTTCELLDYYWLEQKASYMEFPNVMKATKTAVQEALSSQRYDTTAELTTHLRSLCR